MVAKTPKHSAGHLAIVESNGPVFQNLVSFVPFAGKNYNVARTRFLNGARDGGGAIRLDDMRHIVRRMPTSASFMMASGSSERGLSLVRTTKSLFSAAACPISGRLVRSRSPPQPNRVMMRLGARPRATAMVFSARRRYARNPPPRRRAALRRYARNGPARRGIARCLAR